MQSTARLHVTQDSRPDRQALGAPVARSVPLRAGPIALAAALFVFAIGAQPAGSAEGLYLTWNDCYQGPTATSNMDFACDTNTGQAELYCAFTMPQAADNVVAVEIVVDVQHSAPELPVWWRFDPGGCRQGTILDAAASFPDRTACANMWQGAASAIAQVQGYAPSEPGGAASRARINVAGSVLPQEAVSVNATSTYYAARIIIKHEKTVAPNACAGCGEAACLVLNSILIGRLSGGNVFLQTPGAGGSNWALWRGGAGADCAAVPVRRRAWGQLKGLYR